MGNTKTYYIEGELLPGITLEQFKTNVYENFSATYCVAEIVEQKGGYLGGHEECGPYLVTAIHSYSMSGDSGPKKIAALFKYLKMHRFDADWSDVWIMYYEDGKFEEWRSKETIEMTEKK